MLLAHFPSNMLGLGRILLVIGLVLTLFGCAGGSEVSRDPTRLSEVNRALDGVHADIIWRSGETLKNAAWVRVSADSVRYRLYTEPGGASRWEHPPPPQRNERTRRRSIHEVDRIVAHVGDGGLRGFVIGATPGTFLVGISAIGWLAEDCGRSGDWSCLAPALGFFYGAIGALVGGIVGMTIGNLQDEDRQVVYSGPVEHYIK